MEKIIIIKYGELNTKKDNIGFFLKKLRDNIKDSLKEYEVLIKYDRGRMFITSDNDLDAIVDRLKCVFGIHEINIGYVLDSIDFKDIKNNILNLIKDKNFKSFKVETKRSNKKYPINSMEISKEIGAYILSNIKDIHVDVHNPDLLINIEVRLSNAYVYFDKEVCLGGYPVGSLGKGLLMLSGGIDSPVAGYLGIKRGVKLGAIYFESPPHTSIQAKNKVISLSRKLSLYNNGIKLYIIKFTDIQEAILKNIPNEYLITIMRRMMYRISAIIARNNNYQILINGESIGQVASQTLTSMRVINEVVKIPVIRPVACFDKEEIISLAKKIDTFNTSILPYEDCCTIFVPEHPVINPLIKKCEEYEELLNYEELIDYAVKSCEVLNINTEENLEFKDLL